MTWMEFVRQIFLTLDISSIWSIHWSSFEVLCGVIDANAAVATQWPLKYAQ